MKQYLNMILKCLDLYERLYHDEYVILDELTKYRKTVLNLFSSEVFFFFLD